MAQVATEVQEDVIVETQKFEIPTEEIHAMTLTSVKNLGEQKVVYKGEEKVVKQVRLIFTIDDQFSEDGKTALKLYRTLSQSLNAKSNLFKLFTDLGVPVKDGMNVSKLVGTKFQASVEHNASKSGDGRTFANLGNIVKKSVRLSAATKAAIIAATQKALEVAEESGPEEEEFDSTI
jgi:hypothetical protein